MRRALLAGVSTWQARTRPEMTDQPAAVSIAVARGGVARRDGDAARRLARVGDRTDGARRLRRRRRPRPVRRLPRDPDALSVDRLVRPVSRMTAAAIRARRSEQREVARCRPGLLRAVRRHRMATAIADLVLASEWGSILLLLNDGHGRFTPRPTRGDRAGGRVGGTVLPPGTWTATEARSRRDELGTEHGGAGRQRASARHALTARSAPAAR